MFLCRSRSAGIEQGDEFGHQWPSTERVRFAMSAPQHLGGLVDRSCQDLRLSAA
jgi:hypothetical protein